MKNNKIIVKVEKEIIEKFDKKCNLMNMTRTQFIEKIAREDIIFLDFNSKKLIKALKEEVTH